jgi:large subunit ribosomal protein L19
MNVVIEVGKELASSKRELEFEVGDTIKVHYKIVEGTRERVQIYEGVVIAIDNKGAGKTFTVRRVSYDVGVERIFPLLSPKIAKIEVIRKGKTRRSKLYFLRDRSGKSAKLRERLGVVIPVTTEAVESAAAPAEEAPKA